MSMNLDPEQFNQLRRLLALKRHEQPHPRYFGQFSEQVIARIQAGEHGEEVTFWQQISFDAPWLQRLWAAFDTKPILAATVGVAACALLLSGVVLSDRTQGSDLAFPQGMVLPFDQHLAESPPASPVLATEAAIGLSSMNGLAVSEPRGSLFQQLERGRSERPFQATRVVFNPGN
jgi:hypothetical protein